tara:strand:+ start:2536 stop:2826 length:291 start_codon:yes stop_codon:yes gene_type:complete
MKFKYKLHDNGQATDLQYGDDQEGFLTTDSNEMPDIETLHEQKYLDAQALVKYKLDRKEKYPNLAEQADLQYWDLVNGTTKWKDAIAKVKSDNPKP